MRIIAGTKKGMNLFSPKTIISRPITDRVKESLFDVLYNHDLPEGKIIADLFCGVGSLGLEALSRGAEFVTFVEQEPEIIAILNRNIAKAGFAKESKVIRADAFKTGAPVLRPGSARIRRAESTDSGRVEKKIENRKSKIENSGYDLVCVDPPYADTKNVQTGSPLSGLLDILDGQIVTNGIVAVRTGSGTFLLEQYGRFKMMERRQWGSMAVTFMRAEAND